MSKKTIYLSGLAVLLAFFCMGCAAKAMWGVARLPDAKMLFITTADEEVFVAKKDLVIPYQPVGFLQIRTDKFELCGGQMEGMYRSLERAMSKDLIEKAKTTLGADAVIDYSWNVTSSYKQFMESYSKMAQQNPYCAAVMLPLIPVSYALNTNTVDMKGTAVKKLK